jgi:cyclic peptide transporter
MKHKICKALFLILLLSLLPDQSIAAGDTMSNQAAGAISFERIEKRVKELMEEGKIPGLTLVIVRKKDPVYIKGFGFANPETKKEVTADTLFELGSTSKAFTALAALKCEADGLLNLDNPVSKYLPWFYATYNGEKRQITVRQFLHQTSGIPWGTISDIPQSGDKDALEQTVRTLIGIELTAEPGASFQYATINYDVIGAVIEAVSGMSYEDYMYKHILEPLGMEQSRVGLNEIDPLQDSPRMAVGHKIGFFKARKFESPVFRGNTPAGYIVSNGRDMAKWLRLQLGLEQNDLSAIVGKSHQRDRSVAPNTASLTSYAMGWLVSLSGSGFIFHGGQNPNFTSYVIFNPQTKTGVAVLANSNSNYTSFIGGYTINLIHGKELEITQNLGDGMDKGSSIFSYVLMFYLLLVAIFLLTILLDTIKGRRRFQAITFGTIVKLTIPLIVMLPFLAAIYILPYALANFSWSAALVWAPVSFKTAVILLLTAMGASYIGYISSALFPMQNKYLKSIPMLIILSLSSGAANASVIFLISISLFSTTKVGYLLYFFGLAAAVYVIGRKVLQTKLIGITHNIIYDLRMKLVEKIFNTSYQKFEKLESGRILATLNNDTGQLGGSVNMFVSLISSTVTVIGAFVYLATVAFWATLVTIAVVILIASVYYLVGGKANVHFNEARNTQNTYMTLLNGLQDGFKELSLHQAKKTAYKDEVEGVCMTYRQKLITASIKFVNALMVGETMLIAVLGSVGFAIPVLFPQIKTLTLMGFIMVLLYLIGPVNNILGAIPGIMQMRIAWNRIKQFMQDVPANMAPDAMALPPAASNGVQQVKAAGVFFEYEAEEDEEKFTVGPIDFEANKGEVVFIIGGNGSGKTTLAKLLTGLYIPDRGTVTVDGKDINNHHLGEYFSVVFGDYHLFEKLYDIDLSDKSEDIEYYLDLLRLKDKVTLEDGGFSTINLSGGQRKRLALLRCYLEDRPIYLFDEVAADQDPEFRKFFYRDLLVKMKEKGKMVIAITHDDHYFDVADRVIKMDLGKIDSIDDGAAFSVTK